MKMRAIVAVVGMVVGGSAVGAYEVSPGNFVSGNINLTTNYVFRGVSQTDGNNGAIQGGFDWVNTDYDLYAGIWASNVDSNRGVYLFEDTVSGTYANDVGEYMVRLHEGGIDYTDLELIDNTEVTVLNVPGYEGASMETDFYLGWAPKVETSSAGTVEFDLGYKRYQYFNIENTDINTNEFHIGIAWNYYDRVTLGYTANYSDKYFGSDDAWYHDIQLSVPLDEVIDYPGFTFHANYGFTRYSNSDSKLGDITILPISSPEARGIVVDLDSLDYDDYGVGIKYESDGWLADLSWVDRTKKEQCGSPFRCESTAVFTVSRSF